MIPRIRSFSKIKGDDPTIVIVPPRIAQKPIGISSRDIGISVRIETRLTTGRNNAAAPTFCIKLEIMPTVPEIMSMILDSAVPPNLVIQAATIDMTPVRSKPAPMIITAIIDMTALLANPSKSLRTSASPSRPGRTDKHPSVTITRMAATSTRTISETKRATVNNRSTSTNTISKVRPRDSISTIRSFCTEALFERVRLVNDRNTTARRAQLQQKTTISR